MDPLTHNTHSVTREGGYLRSYRLPVCSCVLFYYQSLFSDELTEWKDDLRLRMAWSDKEMKIKDYTDKQITLMGNRWQPKISS